MSDGRAHPLPQTATAALEVLQRRAVDMIRTVMADEFHGEVGVRVFRRGKDLFIEELDRIESKLVI